MMICSGLLLSSCTGQGSAGGVKQDFENVVWPPSPSAPRIKYIGMLSHPEDLNITRGMFDILKELASGKEDNGMILPMAVVENDLGQLFVADQKAHIVHRFDKKRGEYSKIRIENGKGFSSPVGMAIDKDGNVLVTDSDLSKVYKISVNDDEARILHLKEDFVRPTGIAVDRETGWIYVVDTGLHAVYVFNPDNTLRKKFGSRGTRDGEFNFPTYIWQNGEGHLLITDSLNFRIQIFDRFGKYLGQFGNPGNGTGDLARPKGVSEDSAGHVYVTDALFHNVQIFDESGNFLLNFGAQGTGAGEFWLPVGIFIDVNDYIYVSDSYNSRVQIFQYVGTDQ